jgi:hypothetical protein
MAVKIDKNIPIPGRARGGAIYPWDDLKVGDSFVVSTGTNGRQLCLSAGLTRPSKKFISRIVNGVCRVWRTE